MKIDDLHLVGMADAGARRLLELHPSIEFTSGRRDLHGQAHAMATNVVRNRNYVIQTYRARPEAQEIQDWINRHSDAKAVDAIAAGIYSVMSQWAPSRQAKISRHLGGLAFDMHPVHGEDGAAIKADVNALPGLEVFLDHEAGLEIWHAQFSQ